MDSVMLALTLASDNMLEKLSARAGVKIIRKLVREGTPEALARANRIARSRAIKRTAQGSQISELGKGSEGLATLVADRQHGLSVRKLYDPTGLSSRKMIGRKVQMGKEIHDPLIAETYGFRRTPQGGRQTFHEYVPPAPGERARVSATQLRSIISQDISGHMTPFHRVAILNMEPRHRVEYAHHIATKSLQDRIRAVAEKTPWRLGDVRGANVVGGKAIDFLPFRPHEAPSVVGQGLFGNVIPVSKAMSRVLAGGRSSEQMKRMPKGSLYRLLGKQAPKPKATGVVSNPAAASAPTAPLRAVG